MLRFPRSTLILFHKEHSHFHTETGAPFVRKCSFKDNISTTILPSRLNQSNFFDILLPLAKWNMIICLLRTFLENALKKQNFPFSPLSLHCACISVGNSVFFFFKLAAPCMFCFLGTRASRLSRNFILETIIDQSQCQCQLSRNHQFNSIVLVVYTGAFLIQWPLYEIQ